jgi:NhaA family Na+:H+ antiporter
MIKIVKKVFELESATGILLLFATLLALLIVNLGGLASYKNFISFSLELKMLGINLNMTLHHWISDFLMAIFFLLVGSELKQELTIGTLSSKEQAILPMIGAIGGILLPAIIFYFFNKDQANNLIGFAVPTATDIAFAYGIVSFFGKRICKSLKVFLISLAIFDDLVAITIVALFYNKQLYWQFLLLAFLPLFFLLILPKFYHLSKKIIVILYLFFGLFLWFIILKSGIHATISGVILALCIPKQHLARIIHNIAPAVNFFILPLFIFVNSGVIFPNFSLSLFNDNLFSGIFFGLFLGKQLGVMLFCFVAIKLKISSLPKYYDSNHQLTEVSWFVFYIVAIITGIGFTMSIFIADLAFAGNPQLLENAKIAIFYASFCSALLSILLYQISFIIANIAKYF